MERTVQFYNKQWIIKSSPTPMGPGPNYFGIHHKNVYINKKGELVLAIQSKKNQWSCAEIVSAETIKEGLYEITINSNISNLEPNLVLGFFLYNEMNPPYYDEIDIEFSTWNIANNFNTQYVVHQDNNLAKQRFSIPSNVFKSTHSIELTKDSIHFKSKWYLSNNDIQAIQFSTPRPQTMLLNEMRLRLNLWINGFDEEMTKGTKIKISEISVTPIHSPTNKLR